jgi:hypothetical protein
MSRKDRDARPASNALNGLETNAGGLILRKLLDGLQARVPTVAKNFVYHFRLFNVKPFRSLLPEQFQTIAVPGVRCAVESDD